MTNHEFALACARIIRDSLYVNDGSLQPCVGGVLNPLWVQARSNNAATAIAVLFHEEGKELARMMTERGSVIAGEIGALPRQPIDGYCASCHTSYISAPDSPTLGQCPICGSPEDTAIGTVRAPAKSRYHFEDRPDPTEDDDRIK